VITGRSQLGSARDTDTWLTPKWLMDQLGEFDLDPCAAPSPRPWSTARDHFEYPMQDGLLLPWNGRVFMNPPFSNTVPWIEKHATHGLGISVFTASVESKVWRRFVWPKAKAIVLLHGRTRFCNIDGSTTTGRPRRPVTLVAWSNDDAAVLERSSITGVLLREWRQV
jgi:DNA N-6-adenine-methyltransferase (Dam)